MTKKPKPLEWFLDRIGKRIYRHDVTCDCTLCKDVTKNGIVVRGKHHAEYLYIVQNDIFINYNDKP